MALAASTLNSNKGANGLVTLALNTTTTGAWIEFASKEHATLPPPTLEVTYTSTLPKRPSFFTVTAGTGANLDLAWADNNSTETGFEIERRLAGGSFAPLITLAADAVAYTDTTTTLGTTYEYRIRTTSAAGPSAWTPVVAETSGGSTGSLLGERLTFENWMLTQPVASEASLQADADSDGDGLKNIIEYALGTAPGEADVTSQPVTGTATVDGKTYLTLTFARRMAVTDVALTVEAGDSPAGPWTAIDPLQPENQISAYANLPATGWETITVKDSATMHDHSHRFLRLRASSR